MIRALISDFGGVLTTPLSAGFLAYQEEAPISLEDLGRGDAGGRRGLRRAPAPLARARGDHRGGVRPPPLGAAARRLRPGPPARALLRAHRAERADDRLHRETSAERGLRTALLTNNVREWEPLWRAKLPELDEIFEIVVDSAFVGMRKPEPAIYELTVERLGGGLRAEECLFVDDIELNCEAARALGMTAVLLPELRPGDRRASSQRWASSAASPAASAARARATLRPLVRAPAVPSRPGAVRDQRGSQRLALVGRDRRPARAGTRARPRRPSPAAPLPASRPPTTTRARSAAPARRTPPICS